MKTCYSCGNKVDPRTPHGRRNLDHLGRKRGKRDHLLDFHPLAHFGFCARRKVWLDTSRVDCGNWTHPCHFDVNHHHLALPKAFRRLAHKAHVRRYELAVAVLSVGVAAALTMTAYVSG